VEIVGIIFFFRLENIQNIEKSKSLLKLILNNQYLSNISLFIIFNRRTQDTDKYGWITKELLNKKINLDELKRTYYLRFVDSEFWDCAICYNSFDDNVLKKLEGFASSLA
jgi:hypothetical protein